MASQNQSGECDHTFPPTHLPSCTTSKASNQQAIPVPSKKSAHQRWVDDTKATQHFLSSRFSVQVYGLDTSVSSLTAAGRAAAGPPWPDKPQHRRKSAAVSRKPNATTKMGRSLRLRLRLEGGKLSQGSFKTASPLGILQR